MPKFTALARRRISWVTASGGTPNTWDAAGIPSAKVFDQEDVMSDPHVLDQEYLVEVPTPSAVTSRDHFMARGCIAKFSQTPGCVKQAPCVGENNEEILTRYGMSKEEIQALQARWVRK